MLPNIASIDDLLAKYDEDARKSTQTFKINPSKNTVEGVIDGLDALRQSIYLRLNTEADQFIIFPYTYGITTIDLIGKSQYYVMAVIADRIKEALLQDSRITDVSDFDYKLSKNKLTVTFVVHTIYGNSKEETVVKF